MPQVLNMPVVELWKGCEYARVKQGAEYVLIMLNKLEYAYYTIINRVQSMPEF